MSTLRLDFFTGVNEDFEIKQYKILHFLKLVQENFSRNRLYPQLGELVNLYRNLQEMLSKIKSMQNEFPREIRKIDWDNKEIIYDKILQDETHVRTVVELIEWSVPHIKKAMDEGVAIFDFVDENIEVEKVGIVPGYVEEGYFFVPDNSRQGLNLFRYEVSIFTGPHERHRSLKTSYIRTIPINRLQQPPNSIKLKLIEKHRDLPNPATYSFNTRLDFPFRETIFPIAKRKLMRHIYT